MSLRHRIARQLDPELTPGRALSWPNRLLVLAILIAGALAILETEPTVVGGNARWFVLAELGFGLVFAVEYLLRLWTAVENPRWGGGLKGRLRYAVSLPALVDLVAIVPTLMMVGGASPILLRFVRAIRIIRLAKLGRMSDAWTDLAQALSERRHELMLTMAIAVILMLISSTLLYWAEGTVQPDKFGSIPRALWWSIITLTTIGYGDVFPVTALGKLFAGLTAICGVGLVAMPTGILAAAFSDTVQRRRERVMREQAAKEARAGAASAMVSPVKSASALRRAAKRQKD